MSPRSAFPSPPRTPLSNLDIDGNTIYSPTPSPLYATAKTSLSRSLDAVCSRLDNSESSPCSAHSSMDNTLILPSNSAIRMLSETEIQREGREGTWYSTPPRPATGVPPSGDDDDDDDDGDDDSVMLTPTPKPRAPPSTPRSATPPPLLLHEGLFVTPPKAMTYYPHILEPITECTSVATLRTSHSTLRQGSLSLPLGRGRRSPPAHSLSLTLSNASATSFTLSTPQDHTLEVSPPPIRVPTPLTHPDFKMAQTVKPGHVSASPSCLRDRFLLSAASTPAENNLRVHSARLPHQVTMPGRERRSDAPLSAASPKGKGRVPDGQYQSGNILPPRQPRQQEATSREKGTMATEMAGMRIRVGKGMRIGKHRRHFDGERRTRGGKGRARVRAKGNLRERARVGRKRISQGWDKFRRTMAWICCGV